MHPIYWVMNTHQVVESRFHFRLCMDNLVCLFWFSMVYQCFFITPEFNEKNTLKAEVKPGKNEKIDFQIKQIG